MWMCFITVGTSPRTRLLDSGEPSAVTLLHLSRIAHKTPLNVSISGANWVEGVQAADPGEARRPNLQQHQESLHSLAYSYARLVDLSQQLRSHALQTSPDRFALVFIDH